MAETIKVVKVFIGSPGGLEDERQAAKRIVDEINQSHSEHWGCQVKLVAWEATLAGYSRAQSRINQDLDKCEYFVGVIWNHWGSKPDDGDNRYTSGFEEEFERAKDRIDKGLMKDITLFFKDIPDVQLKDLGPSVTKVIEFREKCIQRGKPLFKKFKKAGDFEPLFRTAIEAIGWEEAQKHEFRQDKSSYPEQPAKADEQETNVDASVDGLIGTSSAQFVTELLQRPSDWDATSPYEIARLRLIAASTSRHGNDELYLGAHDANLLFAKRIEFGFSDQESHTLVDAGIAGFDHQNVPLWYWLGCSVKTDDIFSRIRLSAVIGRSKEKINAIRILQSAGKGVPVIDDFFDRDKIIRMWLMGESTSHEVGTALDFLNSNGEAADLKALTALLDEIPQERKNNVATTVIALTTATSLSDGFEKLFEFDPDPLGESPVDKLFARPESIPTETLERCLLLKSDIIRRNAAAILHFRKAIDSTTAERLMTDGDLEVRLAAVESLIQQDKAPEEATIKKALIQQKPRGLLGMGSHTDDRYYERFQRNQLSQLSYEELREKADTCSVYDHIEISTLYQRFTKRNLPEIRRNLEDGFKNHFDSKVEHLALAYADAAKDVKARGEKIVKATRESEGFLRERLTTDTLDALCAYGDSADLKIVRKTLDQNDVDFSEEASRFLGRFGDWSDKDRILSFYSRHSRAQSLLYMGSPERAKLVATALYAIGKSRLVDLLRLDADITVKRALIAEMSQKDVRGLSEDVIMAELNNKDDQFRKTLALKCAQAMSQTHIRNLLDRYINQDGQRYYNSVHWLDLGASMPRKIVKTVAKFELAKLG